MTAFLYNVEAPALLTDDQIDRTIAEIDQALAACAKLKPDWRALYRDGAGSWHDDPRSNTVQIVAREGSTEYPIAGGTIYDTQREVFFMAAMREEYPEVLRAWRASLVYIRELRKKAARKKVRRG